MRRVSAPDLVGFPTQRQGHNDQVAGGALNQGRARAGPVLADDQVAFPVARDYPIRNVRALINQPHPNNGGLSPLAGGFLRIDRREGKQMPCSISVFLGWASIHVSIASWLIVWPWAWGELSIGATVPHASSRKWCADLAGRAPLRQISKHAAAKNLVEVQEPLLRAAPGHLRRSPGVLGPIRPIRTHMAGDFTAHHRGATPNRTGDTHLGQARIHPRHDRRTIPGTKHPTTPHDQPPNSITATRKLLTPYDTAMCNTK